MCTVTILKTDSLCRIACNRDEARTRPPARPPRLALLRRSEGHGRMLAAYPLDPLGGGTWVGLNERGIAMVLLNVNDPVRSIHSVRLVESRGRIIPSLLGAATLAAAEGQALALDPSRFEPFRLVMTDGTGVIVVRSDGAALTVAREILRERPLLFTSSGLGDERVEEPRRALFERFFPTQEHRATRLIASQDAFHRHSWPEAPGISVCMRRPEAATVSFTVLEMSAMESSFAYREGPPDVRSVPERFYLPLVRDAADPAIGTGSGTDPAFLRQSSRPPGVHAA